MSEPIEDKVLMKTRETSYRERFKDVVILNMIV